MDIKNPTPEFGVSSTIMQGRRSGASATPSIALGIYIFAFFVKNVKATKFDTIPKLSLQGQAGGVCNGNEKLRASPSAYGVDKRHPTSRALSPHRAVVATSRTQLLLEKRKPAWLSQIRGKTVFLIRQGFQQRISRILIELNVEFRSHVVRQFEKLATTGHRKQ